MRVSPVRVRTCLLGRTGFPMVFGSIVEVILGMNGGEEEKVKGRNYSKAPTIYVTDRTCEAMVCCRTGDVMMDIRHILCQSNLFGI
jgi:hypothetical protein